MAESSPNPQGPPAGAGPAAPPPLSPLTDALRAFQASSAGRTVSLGELADALKERGTAVLIILLAAPFVPPIPLPGLSLLFGVALALLGPRLGLRRKPWLPRFLLRRPISPQRLATIVRATERVARPIERLLRPRWLWLARPPMELVAGLAISACALILFPPFPMPFANAFPSLAIVLLALGLMERDGLAVAAGYVMLLISYAHLYLWWEVAVRVLRQLTG
jgi:hypothetical protein